MAYRLGANILSCDTPWQMSSPALGYAENNAAAPLTVSIEEDESVACSACGLHKPSTSFSKAQLAKRPSVGRSKECGVALQKFRTRT